MAQHITFYDKLAFWRGTKRFTDGTNLAADKAAPGIMAREQELDGRSDSTSRLGFKPNNPADVKAGGIPAKTGK